MSLGAFPSVLSSSVGNTDGPVSGGSTDNAIVRWDGTTGRALQNSSVTISDNGDVAMPSTATAGLQLYKTVDQTTDYERLEVRWGLSSAIITTTTGGFGTEFPIFLAAKSGTIFSRLDIRLGAPYIRQGLYTTVDGTTLASHTAIGTFVSFGNLTSTATSGSIVQFAITPTYNQASGTAANTDLLVNRTETAVGSGTQRLIDLQVGGTSRFNVANTGVPNVCASTATPAGGSTTARLIFGTTSGFGVYYGSGAPTVSAAQGSIYLRSDGSSTSTRLYVNTDGGTTWTNVTTAA